MENRTREQNNKLREFFQLKQLNSYDLADWQPGAEDGF